MAPQISHAWGEGDDTEVRVGGKEMVGEEGPIGGPEC